MSTQRPRRQISVSERARHIRVAWNKRGRPPSMMMAAREGDYCHDFYAKSERPWEAILREEAGVPSYGDVVAPAIRELFESRFEWQAFVEFRSKRIAEATNLSNQITARVVREFVRGEREHEALDGLCVWDTEMGAVGTKYRVERAAEGSV